MGNADSKLNFRKAVIQLTTKTQVSGLRNSSAHLIALQQRRPGQVGTGKGLSRGALEEGWSVRTFYQKQAAGWRRRGALSAAGSQQDLFRRRPGMLGSGTRNNSIGEELAMIQKPCFFGS